MFFIDHARLFRCFVCSSCLETPPRSGRTLNGWILGRATAWALGLRISIPSFLILKHSTFLYNNVTNSSATPGTPRLSRRTVVNAFVDDWGEAVLGSLAEPLLSGTAVGGEGGGVSSRNSDGEEGLSGLWPRLSRIHEAMQSLEASRTKVDEARVKTVDQSDPESIAHMLGNVRTF